MQRLRPRVATLTVVPVSHSAKLVTTHRLNSSIARFGSAPEGIVSVRSKGYGPSKDLLKGIEPNSRIMVESKLHPEDLPFQRSVLALAMSNIRELSVVGAPENRDYRKAPAELLLGETTSEQSSDSKATTDALARRELFESTLTDQLATVANLIVGQVCASRKADLNAMEASQSTEMRTLTDLVMQCIRDELQDTLRRIRSVNPTASSLPNLEELSKRISQQVAQSLEGQLQSHPNQEGVISTEAIEGKIRSYFERLETSLKSTFSEFSKIQLAAQSGSAAAAVQAGLSDEVRDSILSTIEQSARLQHENLLNALEDSINTHFSKIERRDGEQNASEGIDVRALEAFIESSLHTATDDIRHSIVAEIKKALGKKSQQADTTNGVSSNVWREEMETFSLAIDKAVRAAQNAFTRTEVVDEGVQGLVKGQAEILQSILNVKELLQKELDTHRQPASDDESSTVDYLTEARPLIEGLQKSLAELDASMEVRQGHTEERLLSVAQVITESVQTAVEVRTTSAVSSAISTLNEQLQRIFDVVQSIEAKEPTPPLPPPDPVDISAAVEAVLVPRMEALVAQLEAALASREEPDKMAHLANSISEAVIAVVKEEHRRREEQAANAPPPSNRDDNLTESLNLLRADLVTTVEREMGKTHEVNLTPMYQYIDSILVFLKDSFATHETSLDRKIEELSKNLSTMVMDAIASQAQEQWEKTRPQGPSTVSVSEFSPEATEALRAVAHEGAARSEATAKALGERMGELATTDDLKGFLSQVEASLTETVAPLSALLSSQSANDANITSTITDTAATLRSQLSSVEDSISRLGVQHHDDVASSLKNLLQAVDMKSVKEGLANIQSALTEQAASLESLRQSASRSADGGHGVEKPDSVEIPQRSLDFQAHVESQIEDIKKLLEKIDQSNQHEVLTVVQQIQQNVEELRAMNQKDEEQPEDPSASVEVAPSNEATEDAESYEDVRAIVKESVSEVLKRELVSFSQNIQQDLASLTASKESTKRELLTSIERVTNLLDEQKAIQLSASPMLKKDEIESMIYFHTENIKQMLETHSTKLLHGLSENITVGGDSVYTQISDTIKNTQEAYERKMYEGIEKSMGKQTEELQGLVVDQLNRALNSVKSSTTPTIDPQSVAKQVVELLEEQDKLKNAVPDIAQDIVDQKVRVMLESRETSPSYVQPPLWWLPLMILSLCLAIVLCAYYLFACFLLAFVPVPDQCPPGRLGASDSFRLYNLRAQEAKRGRRVVDQVL